MEPFLLRPQLPSSSPLSSPPSSPLSFLSQSPSPPSPLDLDASKRYPSPSTSSAPSGSVSPIKMPYLNDGDETQSQEDGPPPAKRRRITTASTPRKPRSTEYLDLEDLDETQEADLDRLVLALRKKKRIVVIAGAGISVSAGIPDFRSATGLFKSSGKHLFDAAVYKHEDMTSSFHTMVRKLADLSSRAKPTPFHHMLASLAKEGRLLRLYSQNVDCIDTDMPPLATAVPLPLKGPWPSTIQLHGGLAKMVCTKCNHIAPFDGSLFSGPETPLCPQCREHDEVRTFHAGKRSHGIGRLRPRIVLYNEFHPDAEAIGSVSEHDLRRVPDAVLVVGTSLKVPGVRRLVKELCQVTRSRRDGITAWVNIDPEPQIAEFKDCWDLVVRGKCDEVAEMVGLPRWDEPEELGVRDEDNEPMLETVAGRDKLAALLEQKSRKRKVEDEDMDTFASPKSKLVGSIQEAGIPTPSASPKLRSPLPATKTAATGVNGKIPKQSKLVFGSISKTTAAPSTKNQGKAAPAPAKIKVKAVATAPIKSVASKPKKPRQKQEKPSVSRSLTNAFKLSKSTKDAPLAGKGSKQQVKQEVHEQPLPPLPTPVKKSPPSTSPAKSSPLSLPSLRPETPVDRSPKHTILKRNSSDASSELTWFSSSPTSGSPSVRRAEVRPTSTMDCMKNRGD